MNRKLKAYRIFKGLTQAEVAKRLDITLHSYSDKENGKSKFTLDEAKKLADLFETTVDDIFFNQGVPELGTEAV